MSATAEGGNMSKHYEVAWTIDIYADDPEEAAAKALEVQRDPESIATVFEVHDAESGDVHTIDLDWERD